MSATSYRPTNREWLRRLLARRPHQIIGGPADPYLLRWYMIPRNPWINVYLHKFMRSDDDRALHDHPWWFISLILKGGYTEVTDDALTPRSGLLGGRYWGWDRQIAFRSATFRHRVELWLTQSGASRDRGELPCWTLIVTGRKSRTWGFWCPLFGSAHDGCVGERFVPWQEFTAPGGGCGET